MPRPATFHYIRSERVPQYSGAWRDVMPGDGVVAPYTLAYRAEDFFTRDDNTQCLRLKYKPLFVIGRLNYVPGEPDLDDYVTFIVWSRHGPLYIIAKREP